MLENKMAAEKRPFFCLEFACLGGCLLLPRPKVKQVRGDRKDGGRKGENHPLQRVYRDVVRVESNRDDDLQQLHAEDGAGEGADKRPNNHREA